MCVYLCDIFACDVCIQILWVRWNVNIYVHIVLKVFALCLHSSTHTLAKIKAYIEQAMYRSGREDGYGIQYILFLDCMYLHTVRAFVAGNNKNSLSDGE